MQNHGSWPCILMAGKKAQMTWTDKEMEDVAELWDKVGKPLTSLRLKPFEEKGDPTLMNLLHGH